MKWLPLFLTIGCAPIKKKKKKESQRGAANYRRNFLCVFLSFIFPPLWLRPSEALPSKTGQGPDASGLCRSGAAPGLVVGRARSRAGFNQPRTYGAGLCLSLGKLQNTCACFTRVKFEAQ